MSRERGSSPVELALGVMLLVVPVAIIVLSVAPVFEHRNFVRRAAAEAARIMVLSADPAAEAQLVVDSQASSMGIDPDNVSVVLCGGTGCSTDRGAVVTVEVSVLVEELSSFLPIGSITIRAVHSERVDMYRSRP